MQADYLQSEPPGKPPNIYIYIFENHHLEQEWSYTFNKVLIKQICLGISFMFSLLANENKMIEC